MPGAFRRIRCQLDNLKFRHPMERAGLFRRLEALTQGIDKQWFDGYDKM